MYIFQTLDCIYKPGLNSKPFRSIYVGKAYSTVDSDSSVRWGTLSLAAPKRAGYEPAPGFTFSLPFIIIIISYNTITLPQTVIQSP